MDLPQTIAAVVVPTLTAVGAAIRVAWGAWQRDRDAVIAALRDQLAASIERERTVTAALTLSTQALGASTEVLDRHVLDACPACGADLRGPPSQHPTGQHRTGGAS